MEQTITVIVYHAKGLKPRKKGKHKFSVKFGVGSNKYTTDPVEDLFNNPAWNTESDIMVSDPALPLKLTVLQKDEVLGQVIIPQADLPKFQRHRQIKADLQPHKKCSDPYGELYYEAWISSSASPDSVSLRSDSSNKKSSTLSGFKKLKNKMGRSPMLGRKNKSSHDGGVSYGLASRGAVSMHDLSVGGSGGMFSLVGGSNHSLDSDPGVEGDKRKKKSLSVFDLNNAVQDEDDESMKPEINGVSPRESPLEGGARITIRGENLGLRKDDVVSLYICGSNCLSSLEYISSHKLICTTKPWKVCTGNIVIETGSGGEAVSLVEFAFVASKPRQEDPHVPPSPKLSSSVPSNNSHISAVDVAEIDSTPPPSKPPRRIKSPQNDFPETHSPDLGRQSAPVGSLPDDTHGSPFFSDKRRSVVLEGSSPQSGLSPAVVKKPPPSPKRNAPHRPEDNTLAPHISISAAPGGDLSRSSSSASHNDDKAPSSFDTSRPVAEIKPQLTNSSGPKKRAAPVPPVLLDSRSQSNSPIPPSESPNLDIINGTGNSHFYDISFVDEIHSDRDDDVATGVEEDLEPPQNFLERRESDKRQSIERERRESDKRRSIERETGPVADIKKAPVIPTSPSVSKREFDILKERELSLEIEQRRNTEEIRKWKEAYQKAQVENQDLRDQKEEMNMYIEHLVAHVMIHCPDALNHERLHTS